MSVLAGYYEASAAEKRASAGLTNAQAGVVAPNAAAGQAAQFSQANANNAAANRSNAETAQVAPNAASQRALQSAQVGLTGAQTGLVSTQSAVLPGVSQTENQLRISQTNMNDYNLNGANNGPTTSDNGHIISLPSYSNPEQGDAKGGKVVSQAQADKGKGGKPGPTDTVQALLTPGEAVLNKGAVEHYGSDVIAHMNKMGLMRMGAQSEVAKGTGMADPHAAYKPAPAQPAGAAPSHALSALPGFWKGTTSVPDTGGATPSPEWSGGRMPTPMSGSEGSTRDAVGSHYGMQASYPTNLSVFQNARPETWHGLVPLATPPNR